jgi:DNA-binding CsgD family transcriptional regulator
MHQHADELVGREGELASLEVLDALPSGPVAVVIEGEAGIGKTALWKAAKLGAAGRGYRVLTCRPAEAEAKLPLAGMTDLIEPVVDEVLPMLPAVQQQALSTAMLRGDDPAGPSGQRALSAAVLSALRLHARAGPVVLAIDDVQWLDRPTSRTLAFVVRRLGSDPIGMLLTRRTGLGVPDTLGLSAELDPERTRLLHLTGLPPSALAKLLNARLDRRLSPAELAHVHRISGGNPFYALEIARAIVARPTPQGTQTPPPLPETVDDLIVERIRALPAHAREAVLFASTLGHPTISQVTALLGDQTLDGLRAARDAGILTADGDVLSFTHPLLASAAYADVPAGELRRVHRAIADGTDEPQERALHLALSSSGPDEDVAAALDEASGLAFRRGAPDASAELSTLARELTPPADVVARHRRGVEAANGYFSAGDIPRAGHMLDEAVEELPPGPDRAFAKVRLGAIRYHEERFAEGLALFTQAMDEVGDDPWMRSFAQQSLAYGSMLSGDVRTAHVHATEALAIAQRLDDPALLAGALAWHASMDSLLGNPLRVDVFERAIELATWDDFPSAYWRPSLMLPIHQKWADDLDAARAGFEAELARMLEHGDEQSLPTLFYNWGDVECLGGRYEIAKELLEQADQRAVQAGQENMRGFILAAQATLDVLLGDVDAARPMTQEGLAKGQALGAPAIIALHMAALGFLELSVGNSEAVHACLGPLADAVEQQGFGDTGLFRFLGDEIEALIHLGELDRAEQLIARLQERGETLARPWALGVAARCRALLHAARGDTEAALADADRAVAHHATVGMPFELGRTLLVQGKLRRRSKLKRAARESLDGARSIFLALPAPLWAAMAADELRRVSGRAAASNELTPTEKRVAALVAEGRTDREVAAELFISSRTVSAHLTRIYRKLGIRSRTELSLRLAEHSAPRGQA